jgi:hypothetical protein
MLLTLRSVVLVLLLLLAAATARADVIADWNALSHRQSQTVTTIHATLDA